MRISGASRKRVTVQVVAYHKRNAYTPTLAAPTLLSIVPSNCKFDQYLNRFNRDASNVPDALPSTVDYSLDLWLAAVLMILRA